MWFYLSTIETSSQNFTTPFHAIRAHIDPASPHFDPFYTEMVFVHSQEEASMLPNNILTAWPRGCNWAHGLVSAINWAVNRDEADLTHFITGRTRDVMYLEDFGLSYPLTIADKIDYWEEVSALWQALPQDERSAIRQMASTYNVTRS